MDIVSLQRAMGHHCIAARVRYLTPDLARDDHGRARRSGGGPVNRDIALGHADDPVLRRHQIRVQDRIASCGTKLASVVYGVTRAARSRLIAPSLAISTELSPLDETASMATLSASVPN